MSKPIVKVVAAIIKADEHYLIAKRAAHKSNAGEWEFPGGKIEIGESPEKALEREILEEMGVNIKVLEFFDAKEHEYGEIKIELAAYLAELLDSEFKLSDHDEIRWVLPEDFEEFQFSEADRFILDSIKESAVYFTI